MTDGTHCGEMGFGFHVGQCMNHGLGGDDDYVRDAQGGGGQCGFRPYTSVLRRVNGKRDRSGNGNGGFHRDVHCYEGVYGHNGGRYYVRAYDQYVDAM